jgi:DNA-binding NarL/FixJ family response regulator
MSDPIRVILVDDHAVLREGLRFMLGQAADVDVVGEASDGREAIAAVEAVRPDVVLMDVKMPDMDGLATLRVFKETNPDLPVLILSMYDDPEYVEQALHLGAVGYLLKTVGLDELTRAIRAAFSGDGYLQSEITRPVLKRFASVMPAGLDISLSPRERDVLQRIADGLSTKQIAKDLNLSESTVKTYLRQLFEKLGATHRAHAVALAIRHRIIE